MVEADDVEAAVRRMAGWADVQLTITPITTGITNQNFRVDLAGDGPYVVRIPGERTEVLGIDRSCEAEATRRAAQLGIAPGVRGELPGYGTLVTEFVPGRQAEPEDLHDPDRLAVVVGLLRRFHDSGPISWQFPIFRVVEWHARDAVTHGVSLPAAYDDAHRVASQIETAFADRSTAARPCHNDLLPANVLFGAERAWLIDFEYAGMNDPYFDLANLSVNCGLDAAGDDRLLSCYFDSDGATAPAAVGRLNLMKIMSELREGMWGAVQQGISKLTTIDFAEYAARHLDQAIALARMPEFDRWLSAARAGDEPKGPSPARVD